MNQNITTLKTGKEWVHIVSISLGPCELISHDKKVTFRFYINVNQTITNTGNSLLNGTNHFRWQSNMLNFWLQVPKPVPGVKFVKLSSLVVRQQRRGRKKTHGRFGYGCLKQLLVNCERERDLEKKSLLLYAVKILCLLEF